MAFAPEIVHGDWHSVELALRKIMQKLGPVSTPTFGGITVGGSAISSSTVGNWNTAYGWGNHADAGYITSVSGGDHATLGSLDFASAGHTGFQELATNLTSLAGLTFASASFVKMTAAGVFSLDTNTYYKSGDSPTFANVTDSGITATHVVYAGVAGLLSGSSRMIFDGSYLTLTPGTQGYKFHIWSGGTNQIAIESQLQGNNCNVNFFARDGDGTDSVFNVLRGVGTIAGGVANSEFLYFGYIGNITPANRYCAVVSGASGTGTAVRPLKIYTGANTSQLVLNTDGTVSIPTFSGDTQFNNGVDILGGLDVSLDLDVVLSANIELDLTVGNDVQINGSLALTVDNEYFILGALLTPNFRLYHDGTDTYAENMTGQFILKDDNGTFQFNGSGSDILLSFTGGTYSGLLSWMEDEDYFQFADAVLLDLTLGVTGLSTLTGGILIGASGNIEKATNDLTLTTASQKTLVLSQPVYKDINLAGALLVGNPTQVPGTDQFVDSTGTDTGIETYAFAEDEGVHGGFELQHDYKEGTDLVFHVHWQGIAAPTGTDNVQWRLTYIVSRDNVVLAAATTIDSPDTAIDTQYKCYRSDFTAITGTNFKIGDQFMFSLERVAATGDAYTGDALIMTAGVHYQCDTIGSRQIGTK